MDSHYKIRAQLRTVKQGAYNSLLWPVIIQQVYYGQSLQNPSTTENSKTRSNISCAEQINETNLGLDHGANIFP